MIFADAAKGFIAKHTPPVLSILIAIGGATYQLSNTIQDGFENFAYNAIEPYYLSQEYALKKQLEKLEKDPQDLKNADVELMFIQCSGEFGNKYIPSLLPASRSSDADRTCKRMSELYIDRKVF